MVWWRSCSIPLISNSGIPILFPKVARSLMPAWSMCRRTGISAMKTKPSKRVFGLVIDFGTSQFPKSTRPLTTYLCPSRPGHQALRNNFASSLLLRTWLPYDWTPRSEAYFVFPLAQGTPGKQCGLAATGDYSPSLRSPWLAAYVFPTPVGMNRHRPRNSSVTGCVPHTRGDEPMGSYHQLNARLCSPHPWG